MASATPGDVPIPGSRAVARASSDGAEVRCRSCGQLLFKLRRAASGGVEIERKCPRLDRGVRCGRINNGLVTDRPGYPLADGLHDSLADLWHCASCGQSLGRIHANSGRITVNCRRHGKIAVTAADAINAIDALARAA